MTTRSKAELGAIVDAYIAAQRKHQNRQDLEFEIRELRYWLLWCLDNAQKPHAVSVESLMNVFQERTEELK